ncbi:TPA: DUF4209 domain-containing protein [Stenotrophomonas maltophilia]|nr:DUF4209 domain-containing protein [Stenotrophomonas maltophilia]
MNEQRDGAEGAGHDSSVRLPGILGMAISAEDIAASDWQATIDGLEEGGGRWRKVAELRQQSDAMDSYRPAQAAILRLLAAVLSLHLSVGTCTPLTAALKLTNGRSPSLEDIDGYDANALLIMAEQAASPWVRARLADAALLAGHGQGLPGWRAGDLAARAYLEHARDPDGEALGRRESLQRAMELGWRYLRKDADFSDALWESALALLHHGLEHGLAGISLPIAREIRRRNWRLATSAADAFERSAEAIMAEQATPLAVDWFKEAAALWHLAENSESEQRAHHRTAEALVALSRGEGQAMLLADWLKEGIAILRRSRGDRALIRELQAELAEVRARIPGEMGSFSHEVDVSEVVPWIQKRICADNLADALLQLAFSFSTWTKATEVRESVINDARRFVFTGMFRQVTYDAHGVPIDASASFDAADEEEMERRMVQYVAQFNHPILAQVAIPAALDILQGRFEPTMADMITLLHRSPTTAPGHEWSLARGLLAGLERDWEEAAVFLIPGVEPFVRASFHRAGIHTLSPSNGTKGAEEEKSLNELLTHPDVSRVMSPDLVLELKALLTHKAGHNLRNRYGHGLIRDDQLAAVGTVVLWWTMLRLVLWPYQETVLTKEDGRECSTNSQGDGAL